DPQFAAAQSDGAVYQSATPYQPTTYTHVYSDVPPHPQHVEVSYTPGYPQPSYTPPHTISKSQQQPRYAPTSTHDQLQEQKEHQPQFHYYVADYHEPPSTSTSTTTPPSSTPPATDTSAIPHSTPLERPKRHRERRIRHGINLKKAQHQLITGSHAGYIQSLIDTLESEINANKFQGFSQDLVINSRQKIVDGPSSWKVWVPETTLRKFKALHKAYACNVTANLFFQILVDFREEVGGGEVEVEAGSKVGNGGSRDGGGDDGNGGNGDDDGSSWGKEEGDGDGYVEEFAGGKSGGGPTRRDMRRERGGGASVSPKSFHGQERGQRKIIQSALRSYRSDPQLNASSSFVSEPGSSQSETDALPPQQQPQLFQSVPIPHPHNSTYQTIPQPQPTTYQSNPYPTYHITSHPSEPAPVIFPQYLNLSSTPQDFSNTFYESNPSTQTHLSSSTVPQTPQTPSMQQFLAPTYQSYTPLFTTLSPQTPTFYPSSSAPSPNPTVPFTTPLLDPVPVPVPVPMNPSSSNIMYVSHSPYHNSGNGSSSTAEAVQAPPYVIINGIKYLSNSHVYSTPASCPEDFLCEVTCDVVPSTAAHLTENQYAPNY
ncbi:hypothetical protein HDU76_009178, partial [Blyttiomyces sp. JEL0837]